MEAQVVLGLCQRFGALPSAVLAEDAGVLRLLEVYRLGTPEPEFPEGGEQGGW